MHLFILALFNMFLHERKLLGDIGLFIIGKIPRIQQILVLLYIMLKQEKIILYGSDLLYNNIRWHI